MFEFSPINVEMMKIFGGGCKVRYFGGFSNIVSRVDFFFQLCTTTLLSTAISKSVPFKNENRFINLYDLFKLGDSTE